MPQLPIMVAIYSSDSLNYNKNMIDHLFCILCSTSTAATQPPPPPPPVNQMFSTVIICAEDCLGSEICCFAVVPSLQQSFHLLKRCMLSLLSSSLCSAYGSLSLKSLSCLLCKHLFSWPSCLLFHWLLKQSGTFSPSSQ